MPLASSSGGSNELLMAPSLARQYPPLARRDRRRLRQPQAQQHESVPVLVLGADTLLLTLCSSRQTSTSVTCTATDRTVSRLVRSASTPRRRTTSTTLLRTTSPCSTPRTARASRCVSFGRVGERRRNERRSADSLIAHATRSLLAATTTPTRSLAAAPASSVTSPSPTFT
jgi:hypothetical protein